MMGRHVETPEPRAESCHSVRRHGGPGLTPLGASGRVCLGCGAILQWVGSITLTAYCCDGCRRGVCTCGARHAPAYRDMEERRRDVYRIA